MSRSTLLALACTTLALSTTARAADPGPPEVVPEPEPADTTPDSKVVPSPEKAPDVPVAPAETGGPQAPVNPVVKLAINSKWSAGPSRWFVSALVDVGFMYVRPRFSFGFGRPHYRWVGVEANPILSTDTVGAWAGLRLALPGLELRVGARHMWSLGRSELVQQDEYSRTDLELRNGPSAVYTALEAELSGSFDVGGDVNVFGELAVAYVTGVTDGFNVYEEVLKAVVDPPWASRLRLGWTFAVGFHGALVLGPAAEAVTVPSRGAFILRGGLVMRLKLYDDLEVRGTVMPVFASPDNLGIRGGDAFLIGVRYRWATGWSPKQLAPQSPVVP